MKKKLIKLIAIISIVVLTITTFVFNKNNKVNASMYDQFKEITYENYSGWNTSAAADKKIIGSCPDGLTDIRWGDLDCNGVIDDIDLQYLEHALKRDAYDNGFAARIVYDLADVAEPYGVIDGQDYAEISAVAHGEHIRSQLPIIARIGRNTCNMSAIQYLDGSRGLSDNDTLVNVGIYTGAIRCIGAPRVLAMTDHTGYNSILVMNKLSGADDPSRDGIAVNWRSDGHGIESRVFSAREPEIKWFEYGINGNFYSAKIAFTY